MSEVKGGLPAGWYASPSSNGMEQYWDGDTWTDRFGPLTPRDDRTYAIRGQRKTSHAFHLIMTIITVGLWLPVWIVVGIYNSARKD